MTEAARLPVIDPRRVPAGARAALAVLSRRPIGTVHDERARTDRARLDRAIAGPLASLLPTAHDALCASVARRAARARAG